MEKHSHIARQQFQILHDKANKRFGKLRELQTRGNYSWSAAQSLFSKTFESFSRLWLFQLNNRPALLESGLQRSELGTIANKIGQLYYNYYLRSGDTGALLESYTFYDAVHTRQYLASNAGPNPDPAVATRQMRFYARFVVVCLFLHRREEAMQLLQELQASVSSYVLQYSSRDAQEWQGVVNEVAALMAADQLAMPLLRSPGSLDVPYTPPLRCRVIDPAATCAPHLPRLHEAILVSYRPRQVRVAELPLELFRMAQALEWQQQQQVLATGAQEPGDRTSSAGPTIEPELEATLREGGGAENGRDVPVASTVSAEASSRTGQGLPGVHGIGTSQPAGAASLQSQRQLQEQAGPRGRPARDISNGRSPPRQLLYQPTAQRLLSALCMVTVGVEQAAAEEQFVLLYISADAAPEPPRAAPVLTAASTSVGADAATAVNGEVGHSVPQGTGLAAATATASSRQLLLCPPRHHPATGNPHKEHAQTHLAQHSVSRQLQLPPQPPSVVLHQQAPLTLKPPVGSPSTGSPRKEEVAEGAEVASVQQLPHHTTGTNVEGTGGGTTAATAPGTTTSVATAATADGLLLAEELLSVTRRRVMLVLDSDMGPEFARLQGRELGFPLLCIMAPPWQTLIAGHVSGSGTGATGAASGGPGVGPASPIDPGRYGSLTAQALTCPAQALCALAGQMDPHPQQLQQLQGVLDNLFLQLGRRMAEELAAVSRMSVPPAAGSAETMAELGAPHIAHSSSDIVSGTPKSSCAVHLPSPSTSQQPSFAAWALVFEDCLARRLLLHFAFYRACVHMHPRRNCTPGMAPSCFPPLPPSADVTSEILRQGILRAAEVLGRPGVLNCGN